MSEQASFFLQEEIRMTLWLELVIQSIALGVALAMDAFSVSMANGLNDPGMKQKKMCVISGTFAGFQFAMPMIGWFCVTTIKELFAMFERFIPWIALILLLLIGGKMLIEGIREKDGETEAVKVGIGALLVQGIATSIDALSVGFTIAEYDFEMAIVCVLIIAVVTFIICLLGVLIGKKFGTQFSGRATMLGGVILIAIGIEIFVTGIF